MRLYCLALASLEFMAKVDVDMAPAADAQQQKRSFAADITNTNTTTGQPKKPKQDPKELVLFEWSPDDMANSAARVDATIVSRACRRPYNITMPLQQRHAPKSLLPSAAFYEHKGADAVAAMQARRSGVAPSLADGPLEKLPLFGGMADVDHARKAPANIVGVNEKSAAAAVLGNEMRARTKKAQRPSTAKKKGQILAPPFSVCFDGKLVAKYEGRWQSAVPDIQQKHPGEDFTRDILQALLCIKKPALYKKLPGLKKRVDASKFTAKYDSD